MKREDEVKILRYKVVSMWERNIEQKDRLDSCFFLETVETLETLSQGHMDTWKFGCTVTRMAELFFGLNYETISKTVLVDMIAQDLWH